MSYVRMHALGLLLVFLLPASADEQVQKFPDVLDVEVSAEAGGYRFSVTLSSPYDSPQRYADAFRISTLDGRELGVRTLWHHHANEQPFTRSLGGVQIPAGVRRVRVEGRDQHYGYGGRSQEVGLPGR